jgi:hypothetical protein
MPEQYEGGTMKRPLTFLMLAGVLAGCASEGGSVQPMDPIIVPEAAISVDHMTLFRNHTWVPINRRMLLAEAGTKHYLMTFNQPCTPLQNRNAQILILPHSSNKVTANSDMMSVNNVMCPVNDIYEILPEDASTLRTRAGR